MRLVLTKFFSFIILHPRNDGLTTFVDRLGKKKNFKYSFSRSLLFVIAKNFSSLIFLNFYLISQERSEKSFPL